MSEVKAEDASEHGNVINYGSIKLDKIMLAKDENGTLGCRHERGHSNPYRYQYSLGQTVSLLTEDWLNYMPGRTSFGDHTKVHKSLRTLMGENESSGGKVVKKVEIDNPGYYMITSLSGHFPDKKRRVPTTCKVLNNNDGIDIDRRVVKLLKDNINAVPRLSAEEFNENIFVVKKLPQRPKGTWWR